MTVLQNAELPPNWVVAKLSDLGRWCGGGTPSKRRKEYWTNGNVPWVSPKDMKRLVISETIDSITEAAIDESAAQVIAAGSVLFVTRSGILRHTLPVAINTVPVTINQDLKALQVKEDVDPLYVAYYAKARNREILNDCAKDGTTVQSIRSEKLYDYEIPLAPFDQQRRIVDKIEELFTQLEAGVDALKRVQLLLKQYRQSVLKAAVEGRLTEAWRREHGHEVEPASELLKRILMERRARWEEEELKKFEGKGKKPPKNWKDRYKEPEPPDTSDLPELPAGWVWATVEQVGEVVTGNTPKTDVAKYYGDEYPLYRPADLDEGYHVNNADRLLSRLGLAQARELPERTILVTCIGATIGKTGFIRRSGASNQQINAVIPTSSGVPEFVYWSIVSPLVQDMIKSRSSSTTMPILNKSRFSRLPFPLPPRKEQLRIVNVIESVDSTTKMLLAEIKRQIRKATFLRHSVLSEAFAGQLV